MEDNEVREEGGGARREGRRREGKGEGEGVCEEAAVSFAQKRLGIKDGQGKARNQS
jgi:hypothetical protein